MKKSFVHRMLLPLFTLLAVAFFSSCSKDEPVQPDFSGCEAYCDNPIAIVLSDINGEPVSAEEMAGLKFMREEEKLARDVYVKLYEAWGLNPFKNIGGSEQTHMDAVAMILARYDIEDPAAGKDVGEFVDPDLQALYNTLLAKGLQSKEEALTVGAIIEETDIIDIQEQIDHYVDNRDITVLYQNLLQGSRNHLRGFTSQLNLLGIEYQPQFLSQEQYDEIIEGDHEHGVTGG